MRLFILRAVKEGIFSDFFLKQEQKEQVAVDALYDEIFLDAFISGEDSMIDRDNYCNAVNTKLSDDVQLRTVLISQFDRVDKDETGGITEAQVKTVLHKVLRKKIDQLRDSDDSEETSLLGGER